MPASSQKNQAKHRSIHNECQERNRKETLLEKSPQPGYPGCRLHQKGPHEGMRNYQNSSAAIGLLVLLAFLLLPRISAPQALQVIGHRGAAGLAPENTLAAFGKALDLGVDGIELDVLLTADGEVVVHHDFALKPEIARGPDGKWISTFSRPPLIKDLTLAEIKSYDVGRLKPSTSYGRRYPDQQPSDGERIPTLKEVLSLLKSRGDEKTTLWIEIKTSPEKPELTPPPERVVEAVIKVLEQEGALQRALFLSFDWRNLSHAQRIASAVPTVYLSLVSPNLDNIKPGQPGPSPWTAGIDVDLFHGSIPKAVLAAGGKHWGPHYQSITRPILEDARNLGLAVHPWTVDDPDAMIRLIDMKVDGIITNRPDRLKSILQRPSP